jgi:YrbI family 3-deoxy-D-manno-octulosonate 8-phosphate phosphatase
MTDDSVFIDNLGNEFVKCSRYDGAGVALVHEANAMGIANIKMMIISSEKNSVAKKRAEKLGIECHTEIELKYQFLEQYAKEKLGITSAEFFSQMVYLGNDLNDLRIMQSVTFAIAPKNAHRTVKKVSSLVLKHSGGNGFVRAAIELLLTEKVVLEIMNRKYA